MGMFDYIKCDYPLPGTPHNLENPYQTKDLACTLAEFTITKDGELTEKIREDGELTEKEEKTDFTGVIEFYTNNIGSSGPGYYTSNGEDAVCVDYRAEFVSGKLIKIEQTDYKIYPALPCNENKAYQDINEEYPDIPENISKLFVLWGNDDKGYYADFVAFDRKNICVRVIGDNIRRLRKRMARKEK